MINSSNKPSHRHWKLKEKALKLRAQGLSYKEIKELVPVAKSTISLWCRHVKLTVAQRKRLGRKRDSSLTGIKAIQTMFWHRRCKSFMVGVVLGNKVKDKNSRLIAGAMLYWAEGTKTRGRAGVANSDPRIIKFMASWFREFLGVKPEQMSMHLHLHSGQNENEMKLYWSKITGVPLQNFIKSFIKPEGSGYRKNILYNGTVKLSIRMKGSTYLLFKILGIINGFLKSAMDEPIKPSNWMTTLPYAMEYPLKKIV